VFENFQNKNFNPYDEMLFHFSDSQCQGWQRADEERGKNSGVLLPVVVSTLWCTLC
jgi:hypothetical protein